MSALLLTTSKTASSFIRITLKDNISRTYNGSWLDDIKNKEIIRNNKKGFIFTIVRNPYDRSFSCWKYGTTTKMAFKTPIRGNYLLPPDLSFEDFLTCDLYNDYNLCTHAITHSIPISEYLKQYLKIVQYTIKVENLYDDTRHIMRIIGLDDYPTERIILPTKYTPEEKNILLKSRKIIDLINERYKMDFVNFGYEMR